MGEMQDADHRQDAIGSMRRGLQGHNRSAPRGAEQYRRFQPGLKYHNDNGLTLVGVSSTIPVMDVTIENPANPVESLRGVAGDAPEAERNAESFLTRSEMVRLERAFNDKDFAISQDEKRRAISFLMDVIDNARSKRLKISAVRTLIAADKNDIGRAKNKIIQDKPPEAPRQVTVNYAALTVEELHLMKDLVEKAGFVEADNDTDADQSAGSET